jgi:lysozyme
MAMKISAKGLDLIKKHEGLKLSAYICPAGKWTIGYGHTRSARQGMVITREQADDLLRADVFDAEMQVRALMIPLRQCQFDALVSFVFNVGAGNFRTSTMRRLILAGRPAPEIADQFMRWVFIKGVRSNGLTNRRRDEAALYLSC